MVNHNDTNTYSLQGIDDSLIVMRVRNGDESMFESIFFHYYERLCNYAITITKSKEYARDTVQDVFLKIWRNRADWEINVSLKAYLYKSVYNQALNLLARQRTHREFSYTLHMEKNSLYSADSFTNYENELLTGIDKVRSHDHLIKKIWCLVGIMPERRRQVFELHRKHGLTYSEISGVMEISIKTVENQMSQALQFIRNNINQGIYENL